MSYAQSQHILMHKPWSQMHARTKWYTRLDTHTLTQGAMKLKNRAFTGACRWHGKGGGNVGRPLAIVRASVTMRLM